VLYLNGVLSASSINKLSSADTNDAPTTTTTATNSQLVFGKPLNNSDGEHAKFQTTVFSVLKRFVPKSEVVRLFSYYVGRAIAKSMEGKCLITISILGQS